MGMYVFSHSSILGDCYPSQPRVPCIRTFLVLFCQQEQVLVGGTDSDSKMSPSSLENLLLSRISSFSLFLGLFTGLSIGLLCFSFVSSRLSPLSQGK